MGISKNSVRLSLSKPTCWFSCYIKRLRQAQSDSTIRVFRDALISKPSHFTTFEMKDSLKDFVDRNREGFDNRQPPETAWKKIESNLPGKSVSLWNSVVLWRTAAVLLLGASGYLFFSPQVVKNNRMDTAQAKGEFNDLEVFYSSQIVEKKELVSRFQSETGLTEDEVTQNLQKLEAMYQVLRDEMKARPTQDVQDALVLNLLVRIDLLNQQLNKLDKRGRTGNATVNS
jgi:uncharacterized protein HemX